MPKFLVLYMAKSADFEKMMKTSTPEQQKKGMDDWMTWMGAHKASMVDGGAPLGKTKRVDLEGASDMKKRGRRLFDHPGRNSCSGYQIIWKEPPASANAGRLDRSR
jgi:hypothetical protein